MQQNIAKKIREYLPKINANDISFDDNSSMPYEKNLNQFTENIQIWSHTILEKAKLPTAAHEAKALITKYGLECNEGCALRMVIELEAVNSSLEIHDASTAALASMKLLEAIWHSSVFQAENNQDTIQERTDSVDVPSSSQSQSPARDITPAQTENNKNKTLYQTTINDLKEKYPHCNINALRLLAATRLNVGKQELDDLDINPQ
jgi:hypothetical protein